MPLPSKFPKLKFPVYLTVFEFTLNGIFEQQFMSKPEPCGTEFKVSPR